MAAPADTPYSWPRAIRGDRYVRSDVVARVRTFLAQGGVYQRDVAAAVAAAMLAESAPR